jgi:hypothetical protein
VAERGQLAGDGDALLGRTTALALALLIVGGYGLSWTWTGFADNGTIWDWLQLLALTAAGSALGLLVIAGYAFDWDGTGFRGNTFWDWLHLLLVPFLLPAAVTWLSARAREPASSAARTRSARLE